jgi:hypothetical protein
MNQVFKLAVALAAATTLVVIVNGGVGPMGPARFAAGSGLIFALGAGVAYRWWRATRRAK